MLLYLVKHSRLDIANAVCECTKVLDGANENAYQEMLCIIKYVLDTRNLGLKIQPTFRYKKSWELICYSDSDYASDVDTRRSISGIVLYVCQVPVSWRSKRQWSLTLSSSEAECAALSKAVKEVMFVSQLFTSMKIQVQYPIIVHAHQHS